MRDLLGGSVEPPHRRSPARTTTAASGAGERDARDADQREHPAQAPERVVDVARAEGDLDGPAVAQGRGQDPDAPAVEAPSRRKPSRAPAPPGGTASSTGGAGRRRRLRRAARRPGRDDLTRRPGRPRGRRRCAASSDQPERPRGRDRAAARRRRARAGGRRPASRSWSRTATYTSADTISDDDRPRRPAERQPDVRRLMLLAQHVPDAAHGVDQPRLAALLELAPQVADVDGEGVRRRGRGRSPRPARTAPRG